MLFHIQDALQVPVGGMVPLAEDTYAAELLRRAVGKQAATRLVSQVGATAALRLSAADLATIGGVSSKLAERLVAARDYAHAVLTRRRTQTASADAVVAALPKDFAFAEVEMLFAFALDGAFHVKGVALVAKGGASEAAVTPRDVFLPLVRIGATSFVLAHNHPTGGTPSPSEADVILTNTMSRLGVRLGIQLVDHIIVASGGTFSFQENGLLLSDKELTTMLHEEAGLAGGAS